jgi:hypothetical protein
MKRAADLFAFDTRPSASSLLAMTWSTHSEPDPDAEFMSSAASNWEMVVTRQQRGGWVTLRGPETKASPAGIPGEADFLGVVFTHGTFMPQLDMRRLVDRSVTFPLVSDEAFWFDGAAWELPRAHNADVFVERLVRAGLLVHDPVVAAAVHEDDGGGVDLAGLSTRSVERRVARATGLTRGAIRQIARAQQAVELLGAGVAALEVVRRLDFADQPHLTRSLRRFIGLTPSQIAPAP